METAKAIEKYAALYGVHTPADLHSAVSQAVMEEIAVKWRADQTAAEQGRRAYYLSAEFLMGRAVFNNLSNLQIVDEVRAAVERLGGKLEDMEEVPDMALGNGGLGRLAACFLDSAATLSKPLDGYGIRYQYGIFKQRFENGFQVEAADDWTAAGDPWSVRRYGERVVVTFGDMRVLAVPYDTPIIGYGAKTINTLRLWQAEPLDGFDFPAFDSGKYLKSTAGREAAERISSVLYPNDNTKAGKALRLRQEYFFTSASLQDILRRRKAAGKSPLMGDDVAVQLNDTHPVFAIPEYVRLLCAEGVAFEQAFAEAKKVFAYTNHTVMAEALEKWDVATVKKIVPALLPILNKIERALENELREKNVPLGRKAIVADKTVHMANLACYTAYAVNGVAKIHTEILKADTLSEWYALYPERFFNMTNGITQRRWLATANPKLAAFITERVGDGWLTDLKTLEGLEQHMGERDAAEFVAIKRANKQALADFIEQKEGVRLDPDFIVDIQIKRLHEYKRQLLNALAIVSTYQRLKDGELPDFKPTAYIFGAKSAPGYFRAKAVIKYINEIARKLNADPQTNDRLRVVFVSDYNVSYAEKLVAAGDVSEQISAAGTEASGTGNMKLMLNGAVTLGTYDGANIEIAEAAGEENNYIFGARVEELDAIRNTYEARKFYEADARLKAAVDTLIDGTFDDGGTGMFRELYDSLLKGASWHRPDQYFLFRDFDDYMRARLRVNADYGTPQFVRKCMMNTAHAGRFSSDRTIGEYCRDIWKI